MSIDLSGVTASRTSGVAPLAIRFDAHLATSTSVSNPFHFIDFGWNFGETALGNWNYGAVTDKNLASGPIAAHVFETPGSYTVTLTANDGVTTATKTFSITVTDPATVFATTGTVLVDPSAAYVGSASYPGATRSTLSSIDTILSTYAGSSRRILLAQGQVFTCNNPGTPFGAGPGIIGAFGTGAAPVIRGTGDGNAAFQPASDWRIMDLSFDGATNSVSQAAFIPTASSDSTLALRLTSTSRNALLHYTQNATPPNTTNVFVVSCDFQGVVKSATTGVGDYLIWCFGIDGLCVLGTRLYDATGGQHVCRCQFIRYSVFANSYFVKPANSKCAFLWHGPNWASDSGGSQTTKFNVATNCMMGSGGTSGSALSINPQSGSDAEHIEDCIVDSCYVLTDVSSGACPAMQAIRTTYRNNIFYVATNAIDNMAVEFDAFALSPNSDSVWFINNSIKHVANGVHSYIMRCSSMVPTNVYLYNNIRYAVAPDASGAGNPDAIGFTATADSNNSGSVTTDPLWVNGSSTFGAWLDFDLQSSSYAVAAGTTSATDVPDRFDGSRNAFVSTGRSTGAFQYGTFAATRGGRKLGKF